LGNDVLIGTAARLNEMFSSAGFDVNQLKMYIIDDVDIQLRNRLEPKLYRLSESIGKTQRLYMAANYIEQLDVFVDKTMSEDTEWFDFYEEEE
jgi:superfamily II DNA/RNA helicase